MSYLLVSPFSLHGEVCALSSPLRLDECVKCCQPPDPRQEVKGNCLPPTGVSRAGGLPALGAAGGTGHRRHFQAVATAPRETGRGGVVREGT